MNREYHKWYSPALGKEMELIVFGHAGSPSIVFPTSMGRFYDYESRGMIAAIGDRYESGGLQSFCVDSVDGESWYNKSVFPSQRPLRHIQFERYITDEVIPFVRARNGAPIEAVGCSFGGYHAANLAFRHPDLIAGFVSMGGAFDINQFLGGYYDENCYFNCPVDFLPNLNDPGLLDRIRHLRIVLATGETDICLGENYKLSRILNAKGIQHWLDVWGDGTGHDWPWWQAMARKFL